MVTNEDPLVTVEVKSNFPKNAKGFKVCYPSEHQRYYKLYVEPGQRKVIIIQNAIP